MCSRNLAWARAVASSHANKSFLTNVVTTTRGPMPPGIFSLQVKLGSPEVAQPQSVADAAFE